MKGMTKQRSERLRSNVPGPEEIRRLTRFWLRVWPRGDCWEWRGAKTRGGYGHLVVEGQHVYAHRLAYTVAKGPIPQGHQLDHLCRHRWCVRPSHLEAVPPRVNLCRSSAPAVTRMRMSQITHCLRGHELSGENVLLYRGARHCRTCKTERGRLSYIGRRAKRARPCECECGQYTSGGRYRRGHQWQARRPKPDHR